MTPPRHQTQTERDMSGIEAKKKREAEHVITDDATPEEIDFEPATGVVPRGPALDAARARRPTPERVKHAEDRLDILTDELIASRAFVRKVIWRIVVGAIALASFLLGKHS